jgi:hypothetical protein
METGRLAAEAVNKALGSNDLSKLLQYSQKIESDLKPRYHDYWKTEKWLARPILNDFLLNRCGKSKYAQKILAGVIAETKSPSDIFSMKGIFRTYWN